MSQTGMAFKSAWTLAAVAVAGVLAMLFMPLKAFEGVTQELIALFGLMMAGVLPTMVLTASALRAGNLSVRRLQGYLDALRRQLAIWIGLFLISLVASVLVIIGKMIDWSAAISLPLSWIGLHAISVDLIRVLNALITMALALVVLRAVAVGNGIVSLLRLSGEIAISEAQARDDARRRATAVAIDGIPERKGYGDYVELKH